jgi:hypothetical protein
MRRSLDETLRIWGKGLGGCDIHKEFIRATKARLVLLAIERGARSGSWPNLDSVFPNIRCRDFLRGNYLTDATHIAINPPFTLAKHDEAWGQGLVNEAGRFLMRCLSHGRSGQKVAAILPEVLRTGSRYERWRLSIQKSGRITKLHPAGHFGSHADVDVFFLHMQLGVVSSPMRWWPDKAKVRVEDHFTVNVGSVVPHRDRESGARTPFFDTSSTGPWQTIRQASKWRKHGGRLFVPPFVAVRRTSSPSEKTRATASVIHLDKGVAVENHLVVLTPKDGRVSSCWKLVRELKEQKSSAWLNKRIRCRHLTVGSLARLPISWDRV